MHDPRRRSRPANRLAPLLLWTGLLLAASSLAGADPARELAMQVWDRPFNAGRVGIMHFDLVNRAGRSRQRQALMAHSDTAGQVQIAIWFQTPAAIRDTGFLSIERDGADDEDTWLYLPATERVRRLPASERADAFMGTDLSYGDIKDNFRFPPAHWQFTLGEPVGLDGVDLQALNGVAASSASARESGYGRFRALVDPARMFPIRIEYDDPEGQPLKEVTVLELGLVGDAWTALRFQVVHKRTGHSTEVRFEDMRHVPDLDRRLFSAAALSDGVPEIGR